MAFAWIWVMGTGLALGAIAASAAAQERCPEANYVDLWVHIEPPDGAARTRVAQHVETEIRASGLGICASRAASGLAQVRIEAVPPDLSHALIAIQRDAAAPFERELELASVPLEARPLAIASATDELLRSVLAQPSAASLEAAPPVAPVGMETPAETASTQRVTLEAPDFALGFAGTASSFIGQREAGGFDLQGRVWLGAQWLLEARAGASARLTRPGTRGAVQPEHDLHAALGVGYELLPSDPRFGLVAQAGVDVMRVRFDEQFRGTLVTSLGSSPFLEENDLDSSWAVAATLGAEGRLRFADFDVSAAVAALVPLVPATSDWSELTSLSHLGLGLRIGIWVPFGTGAEQGLK